MNSRKSNYEFNVFINCPFDKDYQPLMEALIFTIFDCGFIPRCALEEDNSGRIRVDKIKKLIHASKYGVHDISRTELDKANRLPRFNMPLELGVFLGAIYFGNSKQKNKNALILDREQYRYHKFISDIAGHDIKSHNLEVEQIIRVVRNWLYTAQKGKNKLPGAVEMIQRFDKFRRDLPKMCRELKQDVNELTFVDRSTIISVWLQENPHFP